jgi:hypothetical protein
MGEPKPGTPMGDIVDFKPKPPKPPIKNPKLQYEEFCDFYVKNLETVNALTNFLILNAAKDLDIGKPHGYDVFMLREALMSLTMRSNGIYHPLQDMTDEYVNTFGEPPIEEDT